mmetsp:Transcript_24147/g.51203  ORF Transcript_24147/g.51203 Transcript_24147/m.51203 type:complete len:90 (+) Transcript_24147:58-327(+)
MKFRFHHNMHDANTANTANTTDAAIRVEDGVADDNLDDTRNQVGGEAKSIGGYKIALAMFAVFVLGGVIGGLVGWIIGDSKSSSGDVNA